MADDTADRARRLAQQAWATARDAVAERLPEQLRAVADPSDARLARQLARASERARREHALAVEQHRAGLARRDRVVRRSRRALPAGALVAGGSGTVMLLGDPTGVLWVVAGAGALRAAVAARRLRRPPEVPSPPPPLSAGPPPPPHPRSAAFPAVRRLERARTSLHALLPLVGPAGREVAEQAWQAAGESDTALRWQAARLAAAERHLGVDPAVLSALETGVGAQERLVQAVADLVAAGADPHGAERVQDLADRLHGLAAGLREVR